MAFGNGELTYTDQAVHFAGSLVAEQGGSLVIPQGQVAVGTLAVQVCLILEGAGHGTQGEHFVVLFLVAQHEHAVFIVIPVAADLVQVALGHKGSLGQQPASLLLLILHKALQQLNDSCTVGQQDGQTLTNQVAGGEVFQLTTQNVVVALLGFFHGSQVLFQLGCLGEGNAVHTLEHIVLCIAAPVSSGSGGELHGLDTAGAHQVGTCAQVGEIALTIQGNGLALSGVLLNQLHLILLAMLCHELFSLFGGKLKALQRQVFFNNLLNLRLDFAQILGGKGLYAADIIIETIVHRGSHAENCFGEQTLDSLGHNMGSGVPVGLFALGVVKGQDGKLAVLVDGGAQVHHLAVDFAGTGSLVQTHADALGNVRNGDAVFKLPDFALQTDFHHD